MADKEERYEKHIDEELEKHQDKTDKTERKREKDVSEDVKKEFEKVKEKLETFKRQILKKFPFITSIGLLPPQASKIVEEEEEIPEDVKREKLLHVIVILPDEKEKYLGKIKVNTDKN